MAKASPLITSFNAGEFSPLMAGRPDIKFWGNACRKMRNFLPTIQGPARKRPGTYWVAETKTSSQRSWLWEFEYNTTLSYVMEIGNLYIRFFAGHGPVGAPFEVTTPYATADLTRSDGMFALRFVQTGDVQYIVHRDFKQRKLTRTGPATFTLSELTARGGPFKHIDPSQTITVVASANTGVVSLTASSSIFLAGHVGALFKLEQRNLDTIAQWEAGKTIAINDVRRSDGKNYLAKTAGTTGSIRPIHSRGTVTDGNAGIQWEFLDKGEGYGIITSVTSGTLAAMSVVERIPDGATALNTTTRWAFGAWSDVDGWPDATTIYAERLVMARGTEVWLSVAGDYENFAAKDSGGLVTADMAMSLDITSDKTNDIEWLAPTDNALLVGTSGDEHAITPVTDSEPFGPDNVRSRKQSEFGSRHAPITRVGNGILFVQQSGRKLRDMQYTIDRDGWKSPDATVLSEHITRSGIVDTAFVQEPDSVLWCVLGNGSLVGYTIDRDQEVRGWHPHRIGGYSDAAQSQFAVVESVASKPTPAGDQNELWMIVRRFINGVTVRHVEYMVPHHTKGDDPDRAHYVDCGLTLNATRAAILTVDPTAQIEGGTSVPFIASAAVFAAGDVGNLIHYNYSVTDVTGTVTWKRAVAEITAFDSTVQVRATIRTPFPSVSTVPQGEWRVTVATIGGLSHLQGQTVDVWADGSPHPQRVVVGGGFTLENRASYVTVGLPCPSVLQPNPIESGAADGTAQGKTQRHSRVAIRFDETIGAKYGADETGLVDEIIDRVPDDRMDQALPLFTGDRVVPWPGGYDAPALITVIQDKPAPCTVVAIMPQVTTQDAR